MSYQPENQGNASPIKQVSLLVIYRAIFLDSYDKVLNSIVVEKRVLHLFIAVFLYEFHRQTSDFKIRNICRPKRYDK